MEPISNINNNIFGSKLEKNPFELYKNVYNEKFIDDDILKVSSNKFPSKLIENKFSYQLDILLKNVIYCIGKYLRAYVDNNYFKKIFTLETLILLNMAGFDVEIRLYFYNASKIKFTNLLSSFNYKNDFSIKSQLTIASSYFIWNSKTIVFISTVAFTNIVIKNNLIEILQNFEAF